MNVISLYFALWVTVDKGGDDILYSISLSGSMLAVAVCMPIFGAISDQTGKRRGPLAILTIICCIATALIGLVDELITGLLLFFVANYCYQSSMVFYNGMLPNVSKGHNVGIISGLGVSVGYLGSFTGLLVVKPFVAEGCRKEAFLPTAVMFLLFSLPCFLFVRDPERRDSNTLDWRKAFLTLKKTLIQTGRYPHLIKFICVHFLILDVINTIIAFMSVYANKVIGFDDSEISLFMILATIMAIIGSIAIGWIVRVRGSRLTYLFVLIIWMITLFITIISQNETIFWFIGPLAGIGMGGVWVVSRSLLIELCPPWKIGEFFGIYGMAGKMASIIGPLLWGLTVFFFEERQTFKYRAAVTVLLILAIIATVVYRSLLNDLQNKKTNPQLG